MFYLFFNIQEVTLEAPYSIDIYYVQRFTTYKHTNIIDLFH